MDFEFDFDRESPFQPGIPVFPDRFKGRQETIRKILRRANIIYKGEPQHFFLTGKRRMGKTSVADFVKDYLDYKKNMIGVYVSNKGNDSIETLTNWIIEALINELPHESRFEKAKKWFKDHVEYIEVKGNKVKFKADDELSRSFKNYFPDYLSEIYDEFPQSQRNGMLIIIDDINGLSDSREFADWYKKLADTLAVSNHYELPVYFLLAGYPEKFDALVVQEESFGSIFTYDYIDCLSDEEVSEFFTDTFKRVGMKISDEALDVMVAFSSGLPLMMQQIGESVFWACGSNNITQKDALTGIINAANEIGLKQIRPILDKINETYEDILQNLADNHLKTFKKEDVLDKLNISEEVFEKFLVRMMELGMIESKGRRNSETYQFSNNLYYTYFLIKSFEKSRPID